MEKALTLLALSLVVATCVGGEEPTAAGAAAAPAPGLPVAFAAGSADFTITSADTYDVEVESLADFGVVATVDDAVTQALPIPAVELFAVVADDLAITITSATESVQGNLSGLRYDPSTGILSASMTVTSVLSGAGVQPGPSSTLAGPIVHVPFGGDLLVALGEASNASAEASGRSSIWRSLISPPPCRDWLRKGRVPGC